MPHQTDRLTLTPISAEEAIRIVARPPILEDNWASDYPLDDKIDPLKALIKRAKTGLEPHPFTMYRISKQQDKPSEASDSSDHQTNKVMSK